MTTGIKFNEVAIRDTVSGDVKVPVMDNDDVETFSTLIAELKGSGITRTNTSPSTGHNSTSGYWLRWIWINEATNEVFILVKEGAEQQAVWLNITATGVTGLTNPLVSGIDGSTKTIYDASLSGLGMVYYNLKLDQANPPLVVNGTATLNTVYNGFHYRGLSSPLQIVLPASSTASTAIFGHVSISLDTGGSVSIAGINNYVWERASKNDIEVTLPNSPGSHFIINYRWDALLSTYVLSLDDVTVHVEVPATPALYVSNSFKASNLSANNRNTHTLNYTYTSTVQDGSTYLIVGFISDGGGVVTAPNWVTEITRTPPGGSTDAHVFWGYYKPTQGNLNTGSVTITFTKNDEMGQVVAFEVTGVHATVPIGDIKNNRSTQDRTSIPSVNLVAPAGSLLVSGLGTDRGSDTPFTQAVSSANSFTTLGNFTSTGTGMPGYIVSVREVSESGSHSTPSYTRTVAGRGQLEAFSLNPSNEIIEPPPPDPEPEEEEEEVVEHIFSTQVTAEADDGWVEPATSTFISGGVSVYLGTNPPVTGNRRHSWIYIPNINIPKGATITSATLSFSPWSSRTGPYTHTVSVENVNNASRPNSFNSVMNAPLTTANSTWNLASVTVNQTVLTPNFASSLQEVVDRAGWVSGNAINIHIRDNSSSSVYWIPRAGSTVPLNFVVEYTTGSVIPGPGPEPGSGTFDLVGNPSFNSGSPTWADGTPITGASLTAYNGLIWWTNNPNQHMQFNTDNLAGLDDIYEIGRHLRDRMQYMLLGLRLTGNLRFLDMCIRWLNIAANNLSVGYRGHNTGTVTWSASPYPCWIVREGGQPDSIRGTDLSVMNEVKWHAAIAEITYACHLNRNYASPAGYNYQNIYNTWYNYLTNTFVPKWSGGSISSWRTEYRGKRRSPTFTPGSPGVGPQRYGRAAEGTWPVCINGGDLHSSVSSSLLAHYMGLLTGSSNAAAESQWVVNAFKNTDSNLAGSARVWGHACPSHGSSSTVAQGATYVSYTLMDMVTFYLEGSHPAVDDTLLTQMTRALEDYFWIPSTSNSSGTVITTGHITGTVSRGGFSLGSYQGMSQFNVVNKPYLITLPWRTQSLLLNEADRLQESNKASWAGTRSEPKSPAINLALLLDTALQ